MIRIAKLHRGYIAFAIAKAPRILEIALCKWVFVWDWNRRPREHPCMECGEIMVCLEPTVCKDCWEKMTK